MKNLSRTKVAFGLIAAFALLAIANMLGHPIASPEALAALSLAPVLLGNTDAILSIKDMIDKQGQAWERFKRQSEERHDATDEKFRQVEDWIKKSQRPMMGTFSSESDLPGDNPKQLKAFNDYLRTGREAAELRAMQVGSDPDGGFLVPEAVDALVTRYLADNNPMRQLARVMKVNTGEFKQLHSVGGNQVVWVGETTSRPATTTPQLKQAIIAVHECYTAPALTQTLLDDAMFDVANWIIEEIGEAFADEEGDAFCNGDGVARPRGLFTYTAVSTADASRDHDKFQYVATGASGAFHTTKADPLIRLVHTVRPAYRRNASWLMHPEVLEEIRLLKEATSDQYIFQPGLQMGQPDRLLGYPLYTSEDVPPIAADSLSVAFGDFQRAYTIVDRKISIMRDPYTSKPYVLFYANKRVGGGAGRDTRAVKFLKFGTS